MFDLDHLSYSAICNSYLACARSYRFRYVDRAEVPTAAPLVFGSAYHETVGAYVACRAMGAGSVPPSAEYASMLGSDVLELPGVAALMEALREAQAAGDIPGPGVAMPMAGMLTSIWPIKWREQIAQRGEISWGSNTQKGLLETGLRMLRSKDVQAVINSLTPAVNEDGTLRVEEFVSLLVPGVPVPIIGYIDLITDDGVPCDIKTSARAWSKGKAGQEMQPAPDGVHYRRDDRGGKASQEMQPTFYLAAMNQAGYTQNPGLRFRYYIFTKAKTPKVQVLETWRTPGDLVWLFGMVRGVWEAIEAGHFPPNPTGWKCSPKYCDYWGLCRGAC